MDPLASVAARRLKKATENIWVRKDMPGNTFPTTGFETISKSLRCPLTFGNYRRPWLDLAKYIVIGHQLRLPELCRSGVPIPALDF